MKFMIDFIEDVREEIANAEDFSIIAMLLEESPTQSTQMIYKGETLVNAFSINEKTRKMHFKVEGSTRKLLIKDIIPQLLILDMDAMMYSIGVKLNTSSRNIDIIGFGKSIKDKKYILFITL